MESSEPNFHCDETPTPTRFIRNCEEVGLFQDLQHINPFEVSFGNAVQSSSQTTVHSLPEPLGKPVGVDSLDTPQVVPNAKRIEDYQNTCIHHMLTDPFMEDDVEDVIKLPNNYLEHILPSECYETSVTETKTRQTTLVKVNIQNYSSGENQNSPELEKNLIDLTSSPDEPYVTKTQTTRNEVVEEVFCETEEQNFLDKSITNEFLILHKDKKEKKERVRTVIKPNFSAVSVSGVNSNQIIVNASKNVLFIPSNTLVNSSIKSAVKIHPKPEKSESTIKQKLKKFLKPNEDIIIERTHDNCQNSSPNIKVHDDKITYSRERNRIAQMRSRLKKKKWIMKLKQDTQSVHEENKNLRSEIGSLKTEIAQLKTLLLAHRDCPVTQAMYKGDLSNILPKNSVTNNHQQRPQIPPHGNGNVFTESQNFHINKCNIKRDKILVVDPKKIPISHSRAEQNGNEKKPPLKIIIGENSHKRQSKFANSPNAVKVIHFHHDNSEITDLTCDSS